MKKSQLLGAVCASLAVASLNVNAALVTQTLNGVMIQGTTYDVTFVQDDRGTDFNSYDDIQSLWPSPLITFTTEFDATAAVDAIWAVTGLSYDWTPGSSGNNGFRVPYLVSNPNYTYMFGDGDGTGGPSGATLIQGNTYSFATFAAVPVPAALWLFGSGLLGLVSIARRKKSA